MNRSNATNTPPQTQQSGGDELRLIKELDDLFPTEPSIGDDWSTHWPVLIQFIQARERAARLDQMNYVDQRLIGNNPGGDRVFYDKDACIAESKLKDQQRIISDAMKAELQPKPQAGEGGEV